MRETGNTTKIEIRCSRETKTDFKKAVADLDPNISFEEFIHVVLDVYEAEPRRFQRMKEYGR